MTLSSYCNMNIMTRSCCNRKTWLTIGMDPTTNTDQTRETYWMRMKEYFDANNISGNVRAIRSLRSHWSVINVHCQNWAGVQANVDVIKWHK
jgi:hypothetical protein